ncbi:hypothetical protein SAMN04489729_6908 [Amycolatopsis lurida]|nr:hypothetical protein SAMN04489729_6908 [Amycolatopsis lurida]
MFVGVAPDGEAGTGPDPRSHGQRGGGRPCELVTSTCPCARSSHPGSAGYHAPRNGRIRAVTSPDQGPLGHPFETVPKHTGAPAHHEYALLAHVPAGDLSIKDPQVCRTVPRGMRKPPTRAATPYPIDAGASSPATLRRHGRRSQEETGPAAHCDQRFALAPPVRLWSPQPAADRYSTRQGGTRHIESPSSLTAIRPGLAGQQSEREGCQLGGLSSRRIADEATPSTTATNIRHGAGGRQRPALPAGAFRRERTAALPYLLTWQPRVWVCRGHDRHAATNLTQLPASIWAENHDKSPLPPALDAPPCDPPGDDQRDGRFGISMLMAHPDRR